MDTFVFVCVYTLCNLKYMYVYEYVYMQVFFFLCLSLPFLLPFPFSPLQGRASKDSLSKHFGTSVPIQLPASLGMVVHIHLRLTCIAGAAWCPPFRWCYCFLFVIVCLVFFTSFWWENFAGRKWNWNYMRGRGRGREYSNSIYFIPKNTIYFADMFWLGSIT